MGYYSLLQRFVDLGIIWRISLAAHFFLRTCYSSGYIPALFIFGDSLVDAGNNNYLTTVVKANFPNGIDFGYPFGVPSGRFTNGKTVTDILGETVGLEDFTPPYLDPRTTGDVILKGVNYASAASGILNDTEWFFGYQIHLDSQISDYAKTRQQIISRIGENEAKKLLRRALYVVVAGSNDVMFENSAEYSSWDTFLDTTISRLRSQLNRLYKLDARKIIVANSPAVGCIPFERNLHASINGCFGLINQRAEQYNQRLSSLLSELTSKFDDSRFVCANVYAMLEDILQNYMSYGFEVTDSACCHVGGVRGGILPCGSLSVVCSDRSKYVFWDPFHLTESAYRVVAMHMMDGGLNYMSPMNVGQLLNF